MVSADILLVCYKIVAFQFFNKNFNLQMECFCSFSFGIIIYCLSFKIMIFYRFNRGAFTPDSKEPSFIEFIKYILATDINDHDEHWQPVALRCRICQVIINLYLSLQLREGSCLDYTYTILIFLFHVLIFFRWITRIS